MKKQGFFSATRAPGYPKPSEVHLWSCSPDTQSIPGLAGSAGIHSPLGAELDARTLQHSPSLASARAAPPRPAHNPHVLPVAHSERAEPCTHRDGRTDGWQCPLFHFQQFQILYPLLPENTHFFAESCPGFRTSGDEPQEHKF